MNSKIVKLLAEIKESRARINSEISSLTAVQGAQKKSYDSWSIQEVIEHLVLAERGGYDLICTAAEQFKNHNPVWSGTSENEGLTIEEVIERTWKPKEDAPESAIPKGSWSLSVWVSHFKNCDDLLSDLTVKLKDLPLTQVIYPHFLCGPLNAIQRLEFIRFHIDRHFKQVKSIKDTLGF